MANAKTGNADRRSNLRFPLHRGPFLFAPQYLTELNWFPDFHNLIARVLSQLNVSAPVVQPYEGRQALVQFQNSEFTIDGQGGLFALDEIGSSENEDAWTGPFGAPDVFLEHMHTKRLVNERLGTERNIIENFATLLFRLMTMRFEKAVREHLALVSARIGSPFSEPAMLELWQLGYLNIDNSHRESFLVDDFELDESTATDGTKLFGLGIAPSRRSVLDESALLKSTSTKQRGRPVTLDHDTIDDAMLGQLHRKGIPSPSTPTWTGEIFVKAVRNQIGPKSPGRSTILAKLPAAIQKYKRQRQSKAFQQSDKSRL